MAPDTENLENLIEVIKRLEQDMNMAWKNTHILEKVRQEQDKKLKELESRYAQCQQDYKDLQEQLVSAEVLIETLLEN